MVKYSAAIAAVESELIVRSSHSAQGNPHTIEEVRRILRLHAGLKTGPSAWATVNCRRESNNRVRRYTLRPVTIAPLAGFLRIFLVVLLLLTAAVMTGHPANAQSLEPRSYANTPSGSISCFWDMATWRATSPSTRPLRSRMPRSDGGIPGVPAGRHRRGEPAGDRSTGPVRRGQAPERREPLVLQAGAGGVQGLGLITFFTNNDDFLDGKTSSRTRSIPCRDTSSTRSLVPSGLPSTPPTTPAGGRPSTATRESSWRTYAWV